MNNPNKNILVINAGSSSLKYKVYVMPSEKLLFQGKVENVNGKHAKHVEKIALGLSRQFQIDAVGHRVVHGGDYFSEPARIDIETKNTISELSRLAPLHNPVSLECIGATEQIFKATPQYAVFDTAFHQHMLAEAKQYAIDKQIANKFALKAYGFHGISHRYVTAMVHSYLNKEGLKIISIHLGNGCSIAAVKGGRSLDTSMGFSPVSGLVMATRSGDIDPAVGLHLINEKGWSTSDVDQFLNKQSGLKGLCGLDDMRDIQAAITAGNKEAFFARNVYVYRIKKYIGSYCAVLGGLDALIFTGGVGENDATIRKEICSGLNWMHVQVDPALNSKVSGDIHMIGAAGSACKILVITTNEELEIARQIQNVL